MKHRREKHLYRRRLTTDIRRATVEQMGDHRRWWWMAVPERTVDSILGPGVWFWDRRYGRCFKLDRLPDSLPVENKQEESL